MASTSHPLVFELQQKCEKKTSTNAILPFCAISFIFCHVCFLQLTFLYSHPLVFELQQKCEKKTSTNAILPFCAISFIFCHVCFLQLTFLYNKTIVI